MNCQTFVIEQTDKRLTVIFQRVMQNMIKTQSDIFNLRQQPAPSSTLTKQIALSLYYGLSNPITSFDLLIDSLKSKKNHFKHQFLYQQKQFRACLNSQQKTIDQGLAENCQKVIQQCLKQRGIVFKQIKQNTSRQVQNLKLDEKVLNHLFYFLKINYQHKILCNTNQDIFSHAYIAKIFKCNQKAINYFYDIYCEKSNDFQQPYCQEKRLIYLLFVLKFRVIISRQLQITIYPNEVQIQTQLLRIRQFYLKQYNQNIDKDKDKDRFSVICMNENDMNRLRFNKRKLLLAKIIGLIDLNVSSNKQTQELQRLSQIFNVKKTFIMQQFKRIKNGQASKINELLIKVNQLLDQINYQRWKKPRQSLTKLFPSIPHLGALQGLENFLEQHCRPQLIKLKKFQKECFRKIHHYMISQLIKRQEVLFIDYSIFYQQQVNDYNILLNNKSRIKSSESIFIPHNDAYLYLITGITNKRISFYHIIEDDISFVTYLNRIKTIILNSKEYFPRIIVLNLSLGWKKFQWQRLSAFYAQLQINGFKVIFTFNQQYSPRNINYLLKQFINSQILTSLYNKFSYIKKNQFKSMAQNLIHSLLNQTNFSLFIQDFFRKEYLQDIPPI